MESGKAARGAGPAQRSDGQTRHFSIQKSADYPARIILPIPTNRRPNPNGSLWGGGIKNTIKDQAQAQETRSRNSLPPHPVAADVGGGLCSNNVPPRYLVGYPRPPALDPRLFL